jgi:flagellar biosynthetic protein FliR
MPQLMVTFIGAPFVTGAAIVLLMLVAAPALLLWREALDAVLADPAGAAR